MACNWKGQYLKVEAVLTDAVIHLIPISYPKKDYLDS